MTLLEIINEDLGRNFSSIEEAREQYSALELLNGWLNYEGIIGYTDKLLAVMDDLGFFPAEQTPAIIPVTRAAPYKPDDIIAERRAAHRPVDKRAERRRREINMALSLLKEDVPRKWENRLKKDSCNIKTMPIKELAAEFARRVAEQPLSVLPTTQVEEESRREPEAESVLHLDSYEEIGTAGFDKRFNLQRANDLLEQIDRLRHLDAHDDPELQIAISKAVFDAYLEWSQIIYIN